MTELNKSRNKHTRGPWRHQQGYNNVFTTSDPENGVGSTIVIATALASQVAGGADEADANARRIVACVNACEGFSIEELEGADLFKDSIESQDLIDGLLAALRIIVDNSIEGGLFNMVARAAISKAESNITT